MTLQLCSCFTERVHSEVPLLLHSMKMINESVEVLDGRRIRDVSE